MFSRIGGPTPTTEDGLKKYDHLTPHEALVKAWTEPGRVPEWDNVAKNEVRDAMPLLARALDRMVLDRMYHLNDE